jgi:tetratricopeptide (TPR) repeat protein
MGILINAASHEWSVAPKKEAFNMKKYCRWMAVISFFILFQSMGSPMAYGQTSDTTLKLLQELEALERSASLSMKQDSLPNKNTLEKLPKKKIAEPPVVAKRPLQEKPKIIFAKRQYSPSPETIWKNRRNSEIHWNKGLEYWSNGDFQSAIDQFKQAMRNQPQNPHGHWNLSTLYNRIGDGRMAIYHMKIAHKIYLNDHNRKEAVRSTNKLRTLMKKYGFNENNMPSPR